MKKRKLKKFVLPTIYAVIVITSFFSISLLNNILLEDISDYNYSKPIIKEVTQSVLNEQTDESFIKPYASEKVTIKTSYYNKDDEKEKQESSLILYENTYMPSTGIIYSSDETFDILAVADGTVKNIEEDEILGTVVEISHNTNLSTFYYSLENVTLSVNDEIKKGTIIGKSASNKIDSSASQLLFEVYYQGKSLDPEKFYTMNPDELQ